MRPGATASSSPTITAPARVAANSAAYLRFAKKDTSDGPASSSGMTRSMRMRSVPLDAPSDPFRQLGEAEVHGISYFAAGAAAGAAFLASAFLGAPDLPYLAL